MAKARAIIKRRKAIQNIRKITHTMELIATARFKRAMDRASQAEAYTRKIAQLVADLGAGGRRRVEHPLLAVRQPPRCTLLLVITANRGLCGGYNASIQRMATPRYQELRAGGQEAVLEVAGKRGISFFRFRRIQPARSFTHFEDKVRFEQVEELADRYIAWYSSGRIDRLEVAYTKFYSASRQAATLEVLLPLAAPVGDEDSGNGQRRTGPAAAASEYEFLPDPASILAEILPMALKVRLFKCFLDAAVSEQIARMVAMKGATENAGNMIRTLTMRYNRARQAQITSELAEIVGGAEALK